MIINTMTNFEVLDDPQEIIDRKKRLGQETAQTRLLRNQKVAKRISRRALDEIAKGEYPVITKGSRLSRLRTTHSEAVYSEVSRELSSRGIEIEIHRVVEGISIDESCIVEDVIVPTKIAKITIGDRPNLEKTYGYGYEVVQIYPPTSELLDN